MFFAAKAEAFDAKYKHGWPSKPQQPLSWNNYNLIRFKRGGNNKRHLLCAKLVKVGSTLVVLNHISTRIKYITMLKNGIHTF